MSIEHDILLPLPVEAQQTAPTGHPRDDARMKRAGRKPFLSSPPHSLSLPPRASRFTGRTLDIAVCAGAYLYGSLPLVWLLARQRNVNLKRVGSGNVGATNLMASGGPARAAAGWIFDASKGLAPILVSRRLGRSRAVAELAGVCGVAGQCWPLFLRFSGGRGISAYVGAGAGIDRLAWAGSLLPMIGGSLWRVAPRLLTRFPASARHSPLSARGERLRPQPLSGGQNHGVGRTGSGVRFPARSKSVPLGCFLSAAAFPVLVGARRGFRPRTLVAPTLLSCVVVARRLTASLPDDATVGPAVHPKAWLYRLLYDRNTSE